MVGFQDMIYTLDRLGVGEVLLPFLLIFTVSFAVMQKAHPLGKEKDGKYDDKKYNMIISLVFGLAVVIPHILGMYPNPQSDVVNIINAALPNVAVVLVAILMFLMVIGIFGGKSTWPLGGFSGGVALVSVAIVIYIFGRAAGWFVYLPSWLYWLGDPSTQAMLLVGAVFFIIIYFITKDPEDEGSGGLKKFLEGAAEFAGTKKPPQNPGG